MNERSLDIKIAHWYYNLGLTQEEIARRLSFTRQKVNRIINSLSDRGIVTIKVNGCDHGNVKQETLLEEHFDLKQAIVAESYGDDYLPALASVAARYLDEGIIPGMTIGVSWGKTLAETIKRLSFKKRSDSIVVQLLGVQNMKKEVLKSDEIARALADKLDCAAYMLYAPVVVDHLGTKNCLMKEKSVQKSFEYINQCDMVIAGIGQLSESSTMYRRGLLTGNDLEDLKKENFVGDICVNPVRFDGSWENASLRKRIISVEMKTIQEVENVVAIAGGKDKVDAIIAVLRSGCVNTLIIDDVTADEIVKKLGLNGRDPFKIKKSK